MVIIFDILYHKTFLFFRSMSSTYITEAVAGPTSSRGSTYSYTYESHFDETPAEEIKHYDQQMTNGDVERRSMQTQKVFLTR